MARIFISHRRSAADNAWARRVHDWIREEKGIRGFLDFDVQDGIEAGEAWESRIYAAMNAAQVVIAIVSPPGSTPTGVCQKPAWRACLGAS